jgi:subfamily B ATP-binding cassette protein MsbA
MNNNELVNRIFHTQIKKYLNLIFICLFFMIISAVTTAASAWLLDPAIKEIFLNQNKTMLYMIPLAIIIVFVLKGLSTFAVRIVTIKIGMKVVENIQILMAKRILTSDISYIVGKHSGKFISNFINDTQVLFNVISGIVISSIKEILTLLALIILMFYHDWQLSILALVIIPIAAFFSRKFGKKMGKKASLSFEATENLSKFLSEIIRGSWLVKIYQREKDEQIKISNFIEDRFKKMRKVEQVRLGTGPTMEMITAFAIASVVFFAGYRSMQGAITMGQFVSFLAALMLAYQPVRALAGINVGIQEGVSAAKRIYDLIDQKDQISDDVTLPELNLSSGEIVFKDVSFTYPDGSKVIDKINISIAGSSKTAIIGTSGSGKTTILNLIPRFYNLKEGSILIDNQEINKIRLSSLRKNISIVSQDTVLFDDTIKNNIAYANILATDDDIKNAAKFAAIDDFINSLKDGYNTIVGENGVKLSGGQKQRISIARAILKNSPIILLDEATSSLDSEAEEKIRYALDNLTKNKTTLIISHKFSSIINCDKIYILNKGKIIDEGTHSELVKNSTVYKNLYDKQTLN